MATKVAIPKEVHTGERRVAGTPDTARKLIKLGFEVMVETGAGVAARFDDSLYKEAGCTIVADPAALWAGADVVIKVRLPELHPALGKHESELLREGGMLISFLWPAQNKDLLDKLAARKATVLAMDCVPRVSRAQKMDALSSMANIAGYRAIVEASNVFPRFFMGQITAAGKVPPAKVLIIGAGVAGLAAIGAARAMGAIVRAFDTRPVVREQVQSMGAEFLEVTLTEDGSGEGGYGREMSKEFIDAEMAIFAAQAKEVDIIVTTALIPGKPAPKLISKAMVESMRAGSVIVDLAAEQGGNCEMTKPGEVAVHNGVTIIGLTDLPSRLASQSSQLYGQNLVHFLGEMGGNAKFKVDVANDVIRGALVLHDGALTWPAPRPAAVPAPAKPAVPATGAAAAKPSGAHGAASTESAGSKRIRSVLSLAFAGAGLVAVGQFAPESFLTHLTVFMLACFVGWQVIWNVTPALHTPLMSVTNAISGIIILGGMLEISGAAMSPMTVIGGAAILLASINIAGGFLVTQRMLKMFRK